jgi:hypothetical protein
MKKSPRRKTHLKVALLVALAAFTCWALYGSVSGVSAQEAEKKKVSPMLDPTDPSSVIYLDTSGKLAGRCHPAG